MTARTLVLCFIMKGLCCCSWALAMDSMAAARMSNHSAEANLQAHKRMYPYWQEPMSVNKAEDGWFLRAPESFA